LLTFGSVNYASTAGGYAAVTKGLKPFGCSLSSYAYYTSAGAPPPV